jgi:hypothetical protein
MAKKKAAGSAKVVAKKAGSPAWKTNWPRNGDLRAWFRCCLEKCEAIDNVGDGCNEAHLPIDALADLGHTAEALRYVETWLKRVPENLTLEFVRMAELGAKICLNAGDLPRMEKFLARAAATEKFNTRKCDAGFSLNFVRAFRAFHGILDPAEAKDDEQRLEAQFNGARRRSQELQKLGKIREAQVAAAEMEKFGKQTQEDWLFERRMREVIKQHAALGDSAAVARCTKSLPKALRNEVLDYDTLEDLGMRAEAIAAATRKVKEELSELEEMDDPNIHFPCGSICRALLFLVKVGKKDEANKLYGKVARSAKHWPAMAGFATSAVLTMFAEVAAVLEGPTEAKALLQQAEAQAGAERHTGFRRGAQAAAVEMEAQVSGVDDAIQKAQKLRSPTERRKELAKLYAKGKYWSKLREICQQSATPQEASDIAWWVKFELPGGEAR